MRKSWWVVGVAAATLVSSGTVRALDLDDARLDPKPNKAVVSPEVAAGLKEIDDNIIAPFQEDTKTVDANGKEIKIQVVYPDAAVFCDAKKCSSAARQIRDVLEAVRDEIKHCEELSGGRQVAEERYLAQRAKLKAIVFEENTSIGNLLKSRVRFSDATSENPGKVLTVPLNRGWTGSSYDVAGSVAEAFSHIPMKFDSLAAWNESHYRGP